MTDSQLIQGIIDNNTIVWRYICRNLKSPFTATLKRLYDTGSLTAEDWEDIFQDSCIIMMERVKEGKFEQRPGSSLFSYFIEIGKNNVQNALRKQKKHHPVVKKECSDLQPGCIAESGRGGRKGSVGRRKAGCTEPVPGQSL